MNAPLEALKFADHYVSIVSTRGGSADVIRAKAALSMLSDAQEQMAMQLPKNANVLINGAKMLLADIADGGAR